jgi:hypothetical protein
MQKKLSRLPRIIDYRKTLLLEVPVIIPLNSKNAISGERYTPKAR